MSIPAPSASAKVPPGTAASGEARLPVMTLSAIVTVAPRPKFSAISMKTPPPSAANVSSALLVTSPPVMVTPLMDTVGGSGARACPIVITGPPPSMIVACAPAPTSWTLASIVIPPANVPWPTLIVSPSWAASTAAWIVEKQPGLLPTQRSAVAAPVDPAVRAAAATTAISVDESFDMVPPLQVVVVVSPRGSTHR